MNEDHPEPALPFVAAVQPQLPTFFRDHATPISREKVAEIIARGFVSAGASDIRSEILSSDLGVSIPVDVSLQVIEPGTPILIGVFEQTPLTAPAWDGIHRGIVHRYRLTVKDPVTYEPPF
jgi:hypothetical protein